MKNFLAKHPGSFAAVSGVLLCAVIVLGVYVWSDIRDDSAHDGSLADLFETEMYNSADMLYSALNEGNITSAYHYAKSAEEYAGRAGESDAAWLFSEISAYLEKGTMPPDGIGDVLLGYLNSGEIPDMTVSAEAADDSAGAETQEESADPEAVSRLKYDIASAAAARIIGVDSVLHGCEKNMDGELIFTCKNAYAVIDANNGMPLEAALSLERSDTAGGMITADEGIADASEFLERFYPRSAMLSMGVVSVTPDDYCGTYDIMFNIGGRNTLVSVKNDSGRVVRIVAR